MSEEQNDKATSEEVTETSVGEPSPPSFKLFLETSPPSSVVKTDTLFTERYRQYGGPVYDVTLPDIDLHCDHARCKGTRVFRTDKSLNLNENWDFDYVEYTCSNCNTNNKTFSLACMVDPKVEGIVQAYKFGELPVFGPLVPEKLKKLVGSDREILFRGLQCESQGLGIGAFAYYRRVVEDRKNQLLDQLIKVISVIEPASPTIAELNNAKNDKQFSKSIDNVKAAFPQGLLVNGENPLKLLHIALSKGIHNHSDEECLAYATSIRVVLTELINRMEQLVKADGELSEAVTLLRKPSTKSASD